MNITQCHNDSHEYRRGRDLNYKLQCDIYDILHTVKCAYEY